jgi:uncharacterized membrane protein
MVVALLLADFGGRFGHPTHRPLRILLLVLFVALVAAVVWLLVRDVRHRRMHHAAAGPSAVAPGITPPGPDSALEQLRMRYARREIDRDEHVQKVQDLGGTPPA